MSEFMVLFVFEVVIEPSQPDSFSKKQVHNPNAELLKALRGLQHRIRLFMEEKYSFSVI